MLRGASAYTTWSVEKDGTRRWRLPYGEEGNHVVDFRAQKEGERLSHIIPMEGKGFTKT